MNKSEALFNELIAIGTPLTDQRDRDKFVEYILACQQESIEPRISDIFSGRIDADEMTNVLEIAS